LIRPTKIIAVSGGFDPLHRSHIEYFKLAKAKRTSLVVILNSDRFLKKKKGYAFMSFKERKYILQHLYMVDVVVKCIDDDQTVCETLKVIKPDVFCNGGDRHNEEIPEAAVCREYNIELIDGLGDKVQSSSALVKNARN